MIRRDRGGMTEDLNLNATEINDDFQKYVEYSEVYDDSHSSSNEFKSGRKSIPVLHTN